MYLSKCNPFMFYINVEYFQPRLSYDEPNTLNHVKLINHNLVII